MRDHFRGFVGGFLATLVFHQGVYALFWLGGLAPNPPFNLTATAPLGVPAVISLAFWGGVWGVPIAWLIRELEGAKFWLRAMVLGAVGPSAVALFIVFPLKGGEFAAGWNPQIFIAAALLNGAWGFGLALWMRISGYGRDDVIN